MTTTLERPSTETKLLLISADSHVTEPPTLWQERLPVGLRERAPKFAPRTFEEESKFHKGGWIGSERLKEMDQDGVSAEVFYGGLGGRFLALDEADLQEAGSRVYNDWLAEYCSADPTRLIGIPQIALYNIDWAIGELERCKKMGLVGSSVWLSPHPDLPFHSPHYEKFWAASQELEMPVTVHLGTGFGYNKDRSAKHGIEHYRQNVNIKILQFENALFDVLFSGALERYPRLKFVLAEPEIGWAPFVLQMWDYHYERFHKVDPIPITEKPSFYFDRQVYVSFINDPAGVKHLDTWGEKNAMWSSDFPHPPSKWPHSRELVQQQLGHLPEQRLKRILSENVIECYGLKRPKSV
jgi:predicted TIM-barrel fold metal-dependent hydrolase